MPQTIRYSVPFARAGVFVFGSFLLFSIALFFPSSMLLALQLATRLGRHVRGLFGSTWTVFVCVCVCLELADYLRLLFFARCLFLLDSLAVLHVFTRAHFMVP